MIFCIIYNLAISFIFDISQLLIKRICADVPNRGVQIDLLCRRKHPLDFLHHINTIPFSMVFRTNKDPSYGKPVSIDKKNGTTYDKSISYQFV